MLSARRGRAGRLALLIGLWSAAAAAPLPAQSLTEGSLSGRVALADGTPVTGVALSLQDAEGVVRRQLHSDLRGNFSIPVLAPGEYRILAEGSGLQPVRQLGISVQAGAATDVTIRMARRPPPITSVEEVVVAEQRITPATPRVGETLDRGGLAWPGPRLDLAEAGKASSMVPDPLGLAWGVADMVGGRPQRESQLYVDGVPGAWIRHPGIPGLPAGAPAFPRYGLNQMQILSNPVDVEWSGGTAGTIAAGTRRGGDAFRLEPFVRASSSPGMRREQNPADSSVTSIQAGTFLSGTLVEDRARFAVGLDYEELETPTARPWSRDSAGLGGSAVPLAAAIASIASDSYGVAVGSQVAPVVRAYRGGAGVARIDLRLSSVSAVVGRVGLARWRERRPDPADEPVNGASGSLEGRDGSATVALLSSWPGNYANELRVGFQRNRRDWQAPLSPLTYLVGEGAGIGPAAAWPGSFVRSSVDLAEVFQYTFGAREHTLKAGAQVSLVHWEQDYLYGRRGIFSFGDLDGFATGQGNYFLSEAPATAVKFNTRETSLFAQVIWRLGTRLQLLTGLRTDKERPPSGTPIRPDTAFQLAFGIRNNRLPSDGFSVSPRIGVLWQLGADREWQIVGGATRSYGTLDPAAMSEAMLYDGAVDIRRGLGTFSGWPVRPDVTDAPVVGRRFALFSPHADDYQTPRTTRLDGQLRRSLGSGISFGISAGYHHGDFLLRRSDLNLLAAPAGLTSEGRPFFGTLVQQGGMITVQPGSNRRLPGYDLVSALASTGFANHYEAGVSLERSRPTGLSFSVSYTWSRTRDNVAESWTGDPADQLSPFPDDRPDHEWVSGRSDFDIPHRAVVSATWRSPGRFPLTLGARYRLRSGRPYTPGFRDGVDVNGDGSGRNDPAYLDPAIPGLPALIARNDCLKDRAGRFAERNGCREDMAHAVDVHLGLGLPVRSLGGRIEVTLDGFNLIGTRSGLVDRALLLVDPAGSITTDAQGNLVLPLVANPRFGRLLSRREMPRTVWVGLKLGY